MNTQCFDDTSHSSTTRLWDAIIKNLVSISNYIKAHKMTITLTVVREKFSVKKFLSDTTYDEN